MLNFDARFIARYYVSDVAVSTERSGAGSKYDWYGGKGIVVGGVIVEGEPSLHNASGFWEFEFSRTKLCISVCTADIAVLKFTCLGSHTVARKLGLQLGILNLSLNMNLYETQMIRLEILQTS